MCLLASWEESDEKMDAALVVALCMEQKSGGD